MAYLNSSIFGCSSISNLVISSTLFVMATCFRQNDFIVLTPSCVMRYGASTFASVLLKILTPELMNLTVSLLNFKISCSTLNFEIEYLSQATLLPCDKEYIPRFTHICLRLILLFFWPEPVENLFKWEFGFKIIILAHSRQVLVVLFKEDERVFVECSTSPSLLKQNYISDLFELSCCGFFDDILFSRTNYNRICKVKKQLRH